MKKRERFSVDLSPKTHGVLRSLSEVSGMSKNQIVCMLIDGARPALEESIKALKQAQKKNNEAFDTLDSVLTAQRDHIDILSKDVEKMRKGYQVDIED